MVLLSKTLLLAARSCKKTCFTKQNLAVGNAFEQKPRFYEAKPYFFAPRSCKTNVLLNKTILVRTTFLQNHCFTMQNNTFWHCVHAKPWVYLAKQYLLARRSCKTNVSLSKTILFGTAFVQNHCFTKQNNTC